MIGLTIENNFDPELERLVLISMKLAFFSIILRFTAFNLSPYIT